MRLNLRENKDKSRRFLKTLFKNIMSNYFLGGAVILISATVIGAALYYISHLLEVDFGAFLSLLVLVLFIVLFIISVPYYLVTEIRKVWRKTKADIYHEDRADMYGKGNRTQGKTYFRLRDDIDVREYIVNPDFEAMEYYREKSASGGKYWKGE